MLADAIFAYIDELSAGSIEGYAEAQAAVEDLRRQRRQELVTLLLRQPAVAAADLAAAAQAAGWKLPRRLAVAACSDADLGAIAGCLPIDFLIRVVDGTACIIVPDPSGPGRLEGLERLATKATLALGPVTNATEAARSGELALVLLRR